MNAATSSTCTWQTKSRKKSPNLCHLSPAGPHFIEELNEAGGIPAVMKELDKKGLLKTDLMTVTGKTVAENIADAENKDEEIIRPIDKPYSETGGIAALFGNLAPEGSVVKRSAVAPEMLVHKGPARVFDSEEEAIAAIWGGKNQRRRCRCHSLRGSEGRPRHARNAFSDFRHHGRRLRFYRCFDYRRPLLRSQPRCSYRPRFS